ncbi:YndM family protein [Bacillus sp. CGMCC 1.60114]|uniref:YndM family protein n=1 Tax=unclassified Bacillus (in: firmicutes) TaxID=185979 RepID=UPI00363A63ED
MKHIVALLIKYTAISAVLLVTFGIFQNISTPRLLFISLIITGASYLIGDLFVLSQYGNTVATITDLGLNFFGIWIFTYFLTDLTPNRIITASSFWSALLISVIEIFFHIYMKKLVLHTDDKSRQASIRHDMYATEFSDEYIDHSTIPKMNLSEKRKDTNDKSE